MHDEMHSIERLPESGVFNLREHVQKIGSMVESQLKQAKLRGIVMEIVRLAIQSDFSLRIQPVTQIAQAFLGIDVFK